ISNVSVGATSYTWTIPAGSSILSGQGNDTLMMIAGTVSGSVSVTADNSCGSSAPVSVSVTINALPSVSASAEFGTICDGNSDTLSASGASTYLWSSGGTTSNEIVSPSSTSTYTVTGIDVNGCVNTSTVTVTVNPLPSIDATALNGTVCEGESDSLYAAGGITYLWSTSQNTTIIAVTPLTTTTYTLTGIDVNGCVNTDSITVVVNAAPVLTISSATDTLCSTDAATVLSASPSGGTWSGPGVMGSMMDPTMANIGANTVTYAYTDGLGCSATDSLSIYVDVCTGIAQAQGSALSLFPNPNNGTFTVNWNGATSATIEVFDALGQLVDVRTIAAGTRTEIALETSGIYSVVISTGDGERIVTRVIVEK
ncbi:MAG TPA: T9SS type A sorting domain-containing protein, partial [Bacteroidia bacterium]|nr:T9SS type A sorting domain-containing protein [Bacteroidia bacterium]